MPGLFLSKYRNLWLLLIIILGFILRVYRLDLHSIWGDEKWCISTAVGIPFLMMENSSYKFPGDSAVVYKYPGEASIKKLKNKITFSSKDFWEFNTASQVIEATIYANNSILYFLTLHSWIDAFGASDFSTRFLSLIFGVLTILVVYFISRVLFNGDKIALLAALLTAVCPLLIVISQEAKSHAMATFFCTLATFFFLKILGNTAKKYLLLLYGMSVAASLLSHMLTIHIFAGHALLMIILCRKKDTWVNYVLGNGVAVIIYVFWLVNGGMQGILFLSQYDVNAVQLAQQWKTGDNPFYMPATLINIIKGEVQIFLPLFGNGIQNLGLHLGPLIPFLLLPFIFIWIAFSKAKNDEKKSLAILLILLVSQIFFITLLSVIKGHIILFQPVYGTVNGIPYALTILAFAICIIKLFSKKMRLALYFLVLIQAGTIIVSCLIRYHIHREPNPYYSLTEKIETTYAAGDTVIYSTWRDAQLTNLYLKNREDILQKVDTTIKDQVLLAKHDTSQRMELINFDNGRLKY